MKLTNEKAAGIARMDNPSTTRQEGIEAANRGDYRTAPKRLKICTDEWRAWYQGYDEATGKGKNPVAAERAFWDSAVEALNNIQESSTAQNDEAPPELSTWTAIDRALDATDTGRRFTVYCSHYIGRKRAKRNIAKGLTWDAATNLAELMQSREQQSRERRFGYYSSWQARIFIRQLEK